MLSQSQIVALKPYSLCHPYMHTSNVLGKLEMRGMTHECLFYCELTKKRRLFIFIRQKFVIVFFPKFLFCFVYLIPLIRYETGNIYAPHIESLHKE